MNRRIRRTVLGLLTVALTAGLMAGCGSSKSSSSTMGNMPMGAGSTSAASSSAGGSTSAGNVTDRAFVNDMTPHHASAIAMATIALSRGQHPEIKQLATNIIKAQKSEIALMAGFQKTLTAGDAKSSLGQSMKAMGMEMDTASLKTASPFDKAFIQMMSPHHTGAIAMAKIELAKGQDPKVKALATRIIAAQTKEIAEMKSWLAKWYPGASTGKMSGMSMG